MKAALNQRLNRGEGPCVCQNEQKGMKLSRFAGVSEAGDGVRACRRTPERAERVEESEKMFLVVTMTSAVGAK